MSNELVTVYFDDVIIDRGHLGAILFRINEQEVWIPRSLIKDRGKNQLGIPEWFAFKEELI